MTIDFVIVAESRFQALLELERVAIYTKNMSSKEGVSKEEAEKASKEFFDQLEFCRKQPKFYQRIEIPMTLEIQ